MKEIEYKLTKYEADEGKVFDWKEPKFITEEDGIQVQQHLYAKTLFIGHTDSIDNYIEIEEPQTDEE